MKMVLKMVALNLPPTLKEKGGGYIKFEALEKKWGKKVNESRDFELPILCIYEVCGATHI